MRVTAFMILVACSGAPAAEAPAPENQVPRAVDAWDVFLECHNGDTSGWLYVTIRPGSP